MKRSMSLERSGFCDGSIGVDIGVATWLQMQSLHNTPAKPRRSVCNMLTNSYLRNNMRQKGTCLV